MHPSRPVSALLAWAGPLFLISLWLPGAVLRQSFPYPWGRVWWLNDDAMISMNHARNLAEGGGLCWNPGERVEGFSNFLWTLLMALAHAAGLPDHRTSLVPIAAALALSALTLPLVLRLGRELGLGLPALALAGIGFMLHGPSASHAQGGTENALFTAAFSLALLFLLRDLRGEGIRPVSAWLCGGLALIRVDGLVSGGILLASAWLINLRRGDRRIPLGTLAVFLGPALAYEAFRILYYGELLGNTAHLKGSPWVGKTAGGLVYVLQFLWAHVPLMTLAIFGALKGAGPGPLLPALAAALVMTYTVLAGGDFGGGSRLLLHLIPALWVLAALGWQALPSMPWVKALACLAVMFGYKESILPWAFKPPSDEALRGNVEIGLLLRLNLSPGSKVAEIWAGNSVYFSRARAVDLLGKCDKKVARLAGVPYGVPGHNKFDFEYSLGELKPDIVVGPLAEPVTRTLLEHHLRSGAGYLPSFYVSRAFQERYRAHRLPLKTWRTLYVRADSPERARLPGWRPLRAEFVRASLSRRSTGTLKDPARGPT